MKRKKALVIDDEQIVLDSVERILSQENFDVDIALSSRIGLGLALGNPYDIVLTDIRMPEIGGMRILRDVKRAKPSVPVVMITGYATVQNSVQAMKLGATDYIEKPFTPEELVKRVMAAIDAAGSAEPEEQKVVHREEVLRVLDRAGSDLGFAGSLFLMGADALEEYRLTGPEKLAILTGDVAWLEEHVGKLTEKQMLWLVRKLSAEVW
ncbi:MAG: response regulator [Syntrophorhabdales bacterium]|jgi:FixJ family two-component response regulator